MGSSLSSISSVSVQHPFNHMIFLPPPLTLREAEALRTHNYLVPSKTGDVPVYLHQHDESADLSDRKCLVYSHGNAMDLQYTEIYRIIAKHTEFDIAAYDYTGYGHTRKDPGKYPHEQGCVDNLAGVVDFLSKLGYQPQNIILWGQSIGTGVTMKYAHDHPETYGKIILMSPMRSIALAGETMVGKSIAGCVPGSIDLFTSYHYVTKITTPIFFVHGAEDEVIPFSHGQELYASHVEQMKRLKKEEQIQDPLWIAAAGHNDIFQVAGVDEICDWVKKFVHK